MVNALRSIRRMSRNRLPYVCGRAHSISSSAESSIIILLWSRVVRRNELVSRRPAVSAIVTISAAAPP